LLPLHKNKSRWLGYCRQQLLAYQLYAQEWAELVESSKESVSVAFISLLANWRKGPGGQTLSSGFVRAGRTLQLLSRDTNFAQGFHKTPATSAVVKGLACWEQQGLGL